MDLWAAEKPTLGKALAKRLELPLVDMDDLIVEREGMTIPEIFDQKGESYFRKVESRLVDELAHTPQIVSCGGGVNDQSVKCIDCTAE